MKWIGAILKTLRKSGKMGQYCHANNAHSDFIIQLDLTIQARRHVFTGTGTLRQISVPEDYRSLKKLISIFNLNIYCRQSLQFSNLFLQFQLSLQRLHNEKILGGGQDQKMVQKCLIFG